MKSLLVPIGICLIFFGCTQDECECEIPEIPEEETYFKFEVNGTQHLYEDEHNIAYYIFEEKYAIWSLQCKGFLDSESGSGSRISMTLYNNEVLQAQNEYDLENYYQAGPEFRPRVRIRYIQANGESWEAVEALVQLKKFGQKYIEGSFNASLVNAYNSDKTLEIENGEFRLPLVVAI